MAYTEVKTTGPIEWARLFEGNRDMEATKVPMLRVTVLTLCLRS
jgi:hypothetical protein